MRSFCSKIAEKQVKNAVTRVFGCENHGPTPVEIVGWP